VTSGPTSATAPARGNPAGGDAPVLETRGLRKVYGHTAALRGVTLTVHRGEVFGFLGPNGAGKTTTVKILTGLVRPTAGEARLFGLACTDPRARARLGYLPELFRFPDWITGEGLLDFHARLAGVSAAERPREVRRALDRVGLAGRGRDRIRGYSKGMAQRLGIAQALLGDPALVILDEPTSALDPVGRREIREVIRSLRDAGTTVFLNSHLLSEVEQVCDRIAVVDRGRVVYEGRLADLIHTGPHLRITVDRVDAELLTAVGRYGVLDDVTATTVLLRVPDFAVAPAVASAVVHGGWRLAALVPVRQSLEDAFLALVEQGGDR